MQSTNGPSFPRVGERRQLCSVLGFVTAAFVSAVLGFVTAAFVSSVLGFVSSFPRVGERRQLCERRHAKDAWPAEGADGIINGRTRWLSLEV